MQFLEKQDFYTYVRSDTLDQITEMDDTLLDAAEGAALREVEGYLLPYYDSEAIIGQALPYDFNSSYVRGQRVTVVGGAFAPFSTFAEGDMVALSNVVYRSMVENNTSVPDASNPDWQLIGNLFSVYHVIAFRAEAGVPPSNGAVWMEGDQRNPFMIMLVADITLYHIHSRINPRQVPELREVRYKEALEKLQLIKAGKIDLYLPIKEVSVSEQDLGLRYGSNARSQHGY